MLILPTNVVAEMDDADQIYHCGISLTYIFATIRAIICFIYKLDTDMVFRLAITNINTEHINIVNIPPQNIKPKVISPPPDIANTIHPSHQTITETHRFSRAPPRINARRSNPKLIFLQRINPKSLQMHSIGTFRIPPNYSGNEDVEKHRTPLYCYSHYQGPSKRATCHSVLLRPSLHIKHSS